MIKRMQKIAMIFAGVVAGLIVLFGLFFMILGFMSPSDPLEIKRLLKEAQAENWKEQEPALKEMINTAVYDTIYSFNDVNINTK